MVKITNGIGAPIEVTRGAYEGAFKSLGYYPVDETGNAQEAPDAATGHNAEQLVDTDSTPDDDGNEDNGNEDEFEELIQKPIGQWTKQEVRDFAAANSIDISGTKNAGEAKAIITKYLQEQQ